MSDQELVEKVTYTASLVTKPQDIDKLLDTVRQVTAKASATAARFAPNERQALQHVQQRLEEYLLRRETIRFFTAESLRVQIDQHVRGGTNRRSLKQLVIAVALALAAAVVVAMLPVLPDSPKQHAQLAGSTLFSLLHVGAAWLFLSALPAFQSKLRQAFRVICWGLVALAINVVLIPAMSAFHLFHGPVALLLNSSLFVIAGSLLYAGVRQYAVLVGVKTRLVAVKIPFMLLLPVAAISLVIRHTAPDIPELVFDLCAIELGMTAVVCTLNVGLLIGIRQSVADLYKPPIRALAAAFVVAILTALYVYGIRLRFGVAPEGPWALFIAVLAVGMGVRFLRAGYLFHKVSRY